MNSLYFILIVAIICPLYLIIIHYFIVISLTKFLAAFHLYNYALKLVQFIIEKYQLFVSEKQVFDELQENFRPGFLFLFF